MFMIYRLNLVKVLRPGKMTVCSGSIRYCVRASSDAPSSVCFIASMQLAVNVQIPVKFGGVGGHAIYVGMYYINFTHSISCCVSFNHVQYYVLKPKVYLHVHYFQLSKPD